ncbi:MAG: mediator complex subunit [Piccolia ochrophora]|nr:MAG: mediator complex subunit [Piccolia ochrophora]
MGSEARQWAKFMQRCLLARLPSDNFGPLALELNARNPAPSFQICEIFLKPRSRAAISVDPLIPIYVERLIHLNLVGVADVLRALWKTSRFHHSSGHTAPDNEGKEGDIPKWHNSTELEEIVLLRMRSSILAGQHPRTINETWNTFKVLSRWMSSIVAASTRDEMVQDMNGAAGQLAPEALAIRDSVGMLVIALAESPRAVSALSASIPKDIRQTLAHALSLYIPFLSQTSLQVANRLETIQRQYNIFDGASTKEMETLIGNMDVGGLQINGVESLNIVDRPIMNSRAGLYIFLNAMLVGRPLTDDSYILNYLNSRYKGDISSLSADLIVASFDVLSNAMFRNESQDNLFVLRAFLVNKVPLLLTTLAASMFPPLTPEYCITQAFNHVSPHAFPSLSSMFDVSADGGIFADVRQEFLFACCLHGLVAHESIEPLLGETPMQELPSGGKYTKEQLVSECAEAPERVEGLLGEIEGMDGNAGAVVGAVLEIVHNMCSNKDTMSLKTICVSLARRPLSLDVMLLFSSPTSILRPICQLLDMWRYEDDQGEYQPVYEEFGCTLLLVLAFVHRYDLSAYDLGVATPDSFVANLLEKGHASMPLNSLSEEQSEQLGGWIRGLFETNGISDELMSSCRPQDFYLLVPMLFSQSVLACHSNVMDMETLKGGLEYLLEAFLLPSLVGALTWLTHHIWESHGDVATLLPILQTLIKPPSLSTDAESMHTTILSITVKPVEHALKSLRRHDPSRTDVDPLLQSLQSHSFIKRPVASHHTELESWTSTHSGGLAASLRNTVSSLVLWASAPDINMTPASYTHRQVLAGVHLLGARPVLRALLDELKLQTQTQTQSQNGSGDLALDVVAAVVCAPSTTDASLPPTTQRLSLRTTLRLAHDDAPKLATSDPLRAEATVRLHRRVEAQFADAAASVGVGIDAGVGVGVPGGVDMMHDINVAAAAAGVHVDDVDVDVGMAGLGAGPAGDIDDVLGDVGELMGVDGSGAGGMDLS